MLKREKHPCYWMLEALHEMCALKNPDAKAEADRLYEEAREEIVCSALERCQYHIPRGEFLEAELTLDSVMYRRDSSSVKAEYNAVMGRV